VTSATSTARALPGEQQGPPAVRARGLVKRFGETAAVDGIDLDIAGGGCFGVLGPNGAGKTTLMRMICCVSPPSGGSLEVLGSDVRGNRRAIKRRLGVVPQGETLDTELTVRENLLSFAAYHGVPRPEARSRTDALLDFAQLTERGNDRTDDLSGGMRRRVSIARALVNDPDLVVLDEPTTGLDPQARHLVWDRLRLLVRGGKTLLLTTHYMDEAAQLCDRLVVVDHGRIITQGTPRDLIANTVRPRVVEVLGGPEGLTERDAGAISGVLAGRWSTETAEVDLVGDRVVVATRDAQGVAAALDEAGLLRHGFLSRDATLEDVFLRLTGRALVE
jgi:lipooligosaccharide transport system ATP-binding protein